MAMTTTCDACGAPIPSDTPPTGFGGHQYCDEHLPLAQKYLAELTELHTVVAKQMSIGLAELRGRYQPIFRELPDE